MKKLDNKGFTLVELIAVLAILMIIMSIAIPSISSAVERTKSSQNSALEKVILSQAELYVSKYRNNISATGSCTIPIQSLIGKGYLDEDDVSNYKNKYINFDKDSNKVISIVDSASTDCGI